MATIGAPVIEELSESTCWALLRQTSVGRIALHGPDDDIEVFPVNYTVDHASIVFTTAEGLTAELVRSGRSSTFEVDDFGTHFCVAWSIVVKGTPSSMHRHDEFVGAFDLEVRSFQPGPKPLMIRLVPDTVTGRRFSTEPPG